MTDHVFSPSQVEEFLLCRRRWAWKKIAKAHVEQAGSAQLGDAVHKQLEGYLEGKPLDFTQVVNGVNVGEIAASGIHFLPEPKTPGVEIESKFRFTSPTTRFVWTGRKDFSGPDSSVLPNFLAHDGHACVERPAPFVGDHKTTSGLRWAKTPASLEWDAQAIIYAKEALERTGHHLVDLSWVYYQTKNARASKRVRLRMHKIHVDRAFGEVERVGADMAAIEDAAPAFDNSPRGGEGPPDLREEWKRHLEDAAAYVNTLPPNTGACGAFGRNCPHEHVCKLSFKEKVKGMNSGNDLIDSLMKRAFAADAGTPTTSAPPPPAAKEPEPEPAMPAWATDPVDPLTKRADAIPPPAMPAPPSTLTTPLINPPESALLPLAAALPPPPAPAAEEKPKGKGGRPPGAKNKPKEEESAAPAPNGFVLYIDCFPIGVPSIAIERYLDRAKLVVREQTKTAELPEGLADYRFAPYGQGPGMLSLATAAEVEKDPPAHLVLSTRTPEGAAVLSELMMKAARVVRALG